GMVLVVNAGHLDWACHDHDLAAVNSEMLAFDAAVGVGLDFVKSHPETVLAVAGSHETSGLAITPDFHAEVLQQARASLTRVAGMIRKDRTNFTATVLKTLGWDKLQTDEQETIVLNSDPTHVRTVGGSDALVLALGHIMEKRAGVAWATLDHTGVACPVAGAGIGADRFSGAYDNTEVPRRIAHLLNLSLP
ncbi:MAG: alkaline phosphatase, partial [Candidatus Xenobia bacterium]